MAERNQSEHLQVHESFQADFRKLIDTTELQRALGAARLIVTTLTDRLDRLAEDSSSQELVAPEGFIFKVRPDEDGKRLEGTYSPPHRAHGSAANIINPRLVEVEGGYFTGERFEADAIVVSGAGLIAVLRESHTACVVPEPFYSHVSLVASQTTQQESL